MQEETLKKSVGFSAIGTIGTQIITLLGFVILARMLSPHEFGIMAMVSVFTVLAGIIISMGMGDALIHNLHSTEKHNSTVFWFVLSVALLLCGLFIACASLIADFFKEDDLKRIYQVCAWLLPLNALAIVPMALLNKHRKFKYIASIEILSVVLGLSVALVLVKHDYGIWALVVNLFVISIIKWVFASILSGWVPRRFFFKKEFFQLWGFSGYLFFSMLFAYIADNADRFLVGRYLNISTLGVYEASCKIADAPSNFIVGSLCRVFFPVYVGMENGKDKIKILHLKVLRIVFFFSVPIMLGISALSDHLVLTLFGEQWNGMVNILIIFGFVYLARTLVSLGGPIFLSQGATKLLFYLSICMRINVLFAIIIGLQFGLEGLLWGLLISRTINLFPSLYFSGRLIGISMIEYAKNLFPAFFAGLGMFLGILMTKDLVGAQVESIVNLFLYILFSGGLYLIISVLINKSLCNEIYTHLKTIGKVVKTSAYK